MSAEPYKAALSSDIRREHIANIRRLRDSMCKPLAVCEWRLLPVDLKTVIILMAGFDDGNEKKDFAEFTPPEQDAIKIQIRAMKRALAPLSALSGW